MYRNLFLGIVMLFTSIASAQNNDLIVTVNGDSIACDIIEVNDFEVIFKMKYANKDAQTMMNLDGIKEFKYNVVQKGMYLYKTGTSYIIGEIYPISRQTYSMNYLQNASYKELEYYYDKALKLKKWGKYLTYGAPVYMAAGLGLFVAAWSLDSGFLGGVSAVLFFGGLISPVVGIPMLITASQRIKRINSINNTAFNNISFELKPAAQYNQLTQTYQPALTLNIKF